MKYNIRILLLICFFTISSLYSVTNYNNIIVNAGTKKKYEALLSYRQWCSLIDSMIDLGKLKMADKKVERLLERGRKLNKEKRVYSKLNKLYKDGNTIYMMITMNKRTSSVSISCWKKVSGEFNTDNIYNYRYYRYRTGYSLNGDAQYADTVYINNDPERQIFSEEILKVCNLWDVEQLRSNKNMDGVYGDSKYTIAYKIVMKKNGKFTIIVVPVVAQGEKGDEVTIPYEIIDIK